MAQPLVNSSAGIDLLNDNKPASLEEKNSRQQAKLKVLRERLLADGPEVVEKLTQGGEFRPEEEPLCDSYLRRWLRARSWKLDKTESSIREHANWRCTFCPEGRIKESEVANELAARKIFLQGTDRKGRGFLVVVGAKHNAWMRDCDEVLRVMCFAIDAQLDVADVSLNPNRSTNVLFDLTNIGMSNMDLTVMNMLHEMLSVHFVERLDCLFVYNAPTIFWATWKTFSPILPPVTLQKIKFVYPNDLSELHEAVQPGILPREYGGEAELISVEETARSIKWN